jgi:hypothetical protein
VPSLVERRTRLACILAGESLSGKDRFADGNLNSRAAKRNWLVILIEDVHYGTSHDSGLGLGVHVGRERETRNVDVILQKVDALDEQRRRLHDAALGAGQSTGARVEVNPSFKQTETLGAGIHLKNVHRATIQDSGGLVRELVIGWSNRGQRRIVLLHVVDLGLKQTGDDFASDESVANGTDHLEPERAGSRVVAAECVLSVLGRGR